MSVTKEQLKVLIDIIKLKKKSTTWTSIPEYYIIQQFRDFRIIDNDNLKTFLSNLLLISLNLSIKSEYRGYDYPNLIQAFRDKSINEDLLSDYEITQITERWKELVVIKDKISRF
jgi:hypothetical protein